MPNHFLPVTGQWLIQWRNVFLNQRQICVLQEYKIGLTITLVMGRIIGSVLAQEVEVQQLVLPQKRHSPPPPPPKTCSSGNRDIKTIDFVGGGTNTWKHEISYCDCDLSSVQVSTSRVAGVNGLFTSRGDGCKDV